jgi:hypothetical protein
VHRRFLRSFGGIRALPKRAAGGWWCEERGSAAKFAWDSPNTEVQVQVYLVYILQLYHRSTLDHLSRVLYCYLSRDSVAASVTGVALAIW